MAGLAAVLFTVAIDRVSPAVLRPRSVARAAVPRAGLREPRHRHAAGERSSRTCAAAACRRPRRPITCTAASSRAACPIGKFLTGVLCIGSGHSMGREGPSVQIGAGLASAVGRWLQLSPGPRQGPGAGRRRRRAGGGLQHAGGGGAVRARGDHRRHERRAARIDGRRLGGVGGRRAIDPRQRAAVPRARVSPGASGRAARPMPRSASSAASCRSLFCKGLLGAARGCSAAAGADAAPISRPSAAWSSALLLMSSPEVHGRRLRVRRSGAQRRAAAQDADRAVRREAGGDDRVLCVGQRRRHLRAEPVSSARWPAAPSAGRASTGAVPDGRPRRVRAGRHGHAVCRHHPRADDVGVHDFRDHAGLPDSRAADGREHAQLHDLAALSSRRRSITRCCSRTTCTCRRRPAAPRRRPGRPATS